MVVACIGLGDAVTEARGHSHGHEVYIGISRIVVVAFVEATLVQVRHHQIVGVNLDQLMVGFRKWRRVNPLSPC